MLESMPTIYDIYIYIYDGSQSISDHPMLDAVGSSLSKARAAASTGAGVRPPPRVVILVEV